VRSVCTVGLAAWGACAALRAHARIGCVTISIQLRDGRGSIARAVHQMLHRRSWRRRGAVASSTESKSECRKEGQLLRHHLHAVALLVASASGAAASRRAFMAAMRSDAVLPPTIEAISDCPPGVARTRDDMWPSMMPMCSVRCTTRWQRRASRHHRWP